ncbi:MerR family transcriptional regulator [Paracoccus binzhouensis]|uniref:MerR family transcriptional regulator n=1 Tax=Paracoccus binzhouensis TaxID=2796149 RepID=UPI0018EF26F1|nr:MerR family transcriptional regulator [Paracoccus binzhouensis]
MSKSPDAFRSIGEVSRLVGVAPHVLRYWETQFSQLSPVKRADGRRYYRPDDVRLAAGLCQVMREEGLSIRGAKRLIAADRGAGLRQIGAARLGETLAEGAATERPARTPAVRLAIPGLQSEIMLEAGGSALPAASVAKPPRPMRSASWQPESLPLFASLEPPPATGWLGRLAAAAANLRGCELQGRSLPAQAEDLRTALQDAR